MALLQASGIVYKFTLTYKLLNLKSYYTWWLIYDNIEGKSHLQEVYYGGKQKWQHKIDKDDNREKWLMYCVIHIEMLVSKNCSPVLMKYATINHKM